MKNKHLITILLLFCTFYANAGKIFGKVTDENNKEMPFVTVYIEKITDKIFNRGTVTNVNGEFSLNLPNGEYAVSFRFIGYKSITKLIKLEGKANDKTDDLEISVQLKPESVTLKEVEISSKREDPAYEIIRNAQSKRKFYLEQSLTYTADAYIKGLQRIDEAPKKILGKDITFPGVEKDSANKAIVYLSESISEIYVDKKKEKEIIISSKVSGRSTSFSWNSALDLQLNMYENSIDMGGLSPRPFISPIATTAMVHYRYEYMGTINENSLLLHKIKLIPKQKGSPVYSGTLYIQDDSWRIHSTELKVTKNETGVDFVDSLTLRQVYNPVEKDVWKLGTQTVNFKWSANFLGLVFKGSGYFVGVFSDYKLDAVIDSKLFSGEKLRVLEESNQKDTTYWKNIRPFALTKEESKDYVRKDSIFKVRDSKAFKDSIDKIDNKFKFWSLLTGYTYRNRHQNYSLTIESPLTTIQTNTVEGYVINPKITHYSFNREKYKIFSWTNDFRYGFSSQKFYAQTNIYRRFNGTNRAYIRLQGGTYVSQFNSENPISSLVNSLYTSFIGWNYLKMYEKNYVKFSTGSEITNGLILNVSAEFANRVALKNVNETQYGNFSYEWFTKRSFTPNTPNEITEKPFTSNNLVTLDAELVIRFGQKYMSRPYLKVNTESKFPILKLYYKAGINDKNFHFLRANITDEINLRQLGRGEYNISAGTFVQAPTYFIDYQHFNTSETIFVSKRIDSFFLLSYYNFSTSKTFAEAHYEQHFNGFLTNRIGFMRKLSWTLVMSGHYLNENKIGNYAEFTVGMENIFKFIRADVAFGFGENKTSPVGFRMRVDLF